MFAFSIHDEDNIILVRDHFGQKPIYYFYDDYKFIYSSEINPIKMLLNNIKLDENAINQYFLLGYIPSPLTVFKNIFKVEPSTIIVFNKKISKLRYTN